MIDPGSVRTRGVALVASRLCLLGNDPCGGSEVVLWDDARILQSAGIPVRVYARAARRGAPVETVRLRWRTARLNTIEYSRAVLRNEPGSLVFAYNEPAFGALPPIARSRGLIGRRPFRDIVTGPCGGRGSLAPGICFRANLNEASSCNSTCRFLDRRQSSSPTAWISNSSVHRTGHT